MTNLPGNPYVQEDELFTASAPADRVANAIMALAFEVRTANLLTAARPIDSTTREMAEKVTADLATIAPRLGLSGSSTAGPFPL